MSTAREWFAEAIKQRYEAQRIPRLKPQALDVVPSLCHDAVKAAMTAYLVWKNEPFEENHDLGAICDSCQKSDDAFGAFRDDLASLNQHAVKPRYPGDCDVTPEEIARVNDIAVSLMRFRRDRLPPPVGQEFEAFLE